MFSKKITIISIFYVVSALSQQLFAAENFSPFAIFGEDNRQELYTASAQWKEIGRSLAGRVALENAENHGSSWELIGSPLSHKECSSGKFGNEITVPTCTGFLAKPNVLITAAHCMPTPEDCAKYYWVFGYALANASDSNYTTVNANQVYKCKRLIARNYKNFGNVDYAIIELDRNVENRNPLQLGFDMPITKGQALVNIGHSNGLPLKLKDSASIINITPDGAAFESEMDTFHGDSGSPFFDAATGVVIGITSKGHADHTHGDGGSCRQLKICRPGDNCFLSTTSRISNLKDEPIFKTK